MSKRMRHCPPKRCKPAVPRLCVGPEISLLQENSLDGWTKLDGGKPDGKSGHGWSVTGGVLHLNGRAGDIKTEKEYKNFILDFAWTHSEGGNSGIKYRLKHFAGYGWLGLEYQVLDDFNTNEGLKLKNSTATLYDILPCNKQKRLNPHTEWNYGRIMVNGHHIQHWLNGKKVVDVRVGSKTWNEGIASSKFNNILGFGENSTGFIMIQDHQSEVWFHKISVKEILGSASGAKSTKTTAPCRNYRQTKTIQCKPAYTKKVIRKPSPCSTKIYRKNGMKAANVYRCN